MRGVLYPEDVDDLTYQLLMTAINKPEMAEFVFKGWQDKPRPKGRHLTFYPLYGVSAKPTKHAIDNEDGKYKIFQFRETTIQLDFWGAGAYEYMSDLYLWLSTNRVMEFCRKTNCTIVEMGEILALYNQDNDIHTCQRANAKIKLRYVVEIEEDLGLIENIDLTLASDGENETFEEIMQAKSKDKEINKIYSDDERYQKQSLANDEFNNELKSKKLYKK